MKQQDCAARTLRERKKKVSIVVSDLSVAGAGRWGGAVRTFLLAQALKKLEYEVEIVGFIFGEGSPDIGAAKIPMITVAGKNYPAFLHAARDLIQKIQGDIIYALRPKPTSLGIALLKKLQTQRPIILDIDDWELSWYGGDKYKYRASPKQFARDILKPEGALRQPDHPIYLQWMEKMVSRADAVTIHTRFLQERFGGVYVPNGKDTTLFDPSKCDRAASRDRYGLSGYRILMFPGAPRPYKGIEDVLMALDHLNQLDLRVAIVGGSPYDDYDDILMQKWGRWIIKLPKLPYEVMPAVVAAADIVVVPQRDTPASVAQFPLKLTDGMAMAKPILATKVGDLPEILGDTGYLVTPECPEQIAQQIQWIFDNLELAKERGMRARKRCIEHYSIEAMAGILSGVIEKIG